MLIFSIKKLLFSQINVYSEILNISYITRKYFKNIKHSDSFILKMLKFCLKVLWHCFCIRGRLWFRLPHFLKGKYDARAYLSLIFNYIPVLILFILWDRFTLVLPIVKNIKNYSFLVCFFEAAKSTVCVLWRQSNTASAGQISR